jgi:hypothetical protein
MKSLLSVSRSRFAYREGRSKPKGFFVQPIGHTLHYSPMYPEQTSKYLTTSLVPVVNLPANYSGDSDSATATFSEQ